MILDLRSDLPANHVSWLTDMFKCMYTHILAHIIVFPNKFSNCMSSCSKLNVNTFFVSVGGFSRKRRMPVRHLKVITSAKSTIHTTASLRLTYAKKYRCRTGIHRFLVKPATNTKAAGVGLPSRSDLASIGRLA
jgi:hypothetical protein